MQMLPETLICHLPSENDNERLSVVLCQDIDGQRYELRQQSYGNGVGWFTQSCVVIEADQASALRNVFGAHPIGRSRQLRVVG